MEMSLRVFFNRWFAGMVCLGMIALICSFLVVHLFHLKPCVLCKLQRIPFALLVANATLGLIGPYKKGFFKVTQLCLGLGVLLGGVHFLMQMGMVPDFCVSQRGFDSPEAFLKGLQGPKCSQVAWDVGGVPVSLMSATLQGLVLWVSIRLKAIVKRRVLCK
ncbi:MAG: disulfide bond formation protein B [Chlamydiia bacterium]|nr:disulfide bond formation protein B [Chlamydiia bacterium]